MGIDIAEMRRNYKLGHLGKGDLAADPLDQFRLWFAHAADAGIPEPNAMILSTVSRHGTPSSRFVLMKDIDQEGVSFYTNYESRKGLEISDNPNVALLFPWIMLERQVRVEGVASKVSDEESDIYFSSRPTGSRLGAWTSRQSSVIPSREVLEDSLKHHLKAFGNNIPRPPTGADTG
jgi:pyridoxamine 5'-phosphate oxidase